MHSWSRNLSRPKIFTPHLSFAYRPRVCGGMPESPLSSTPTLPSLWCARVSLSSWLFSGARRQHVGEFDAWSAEHCIQIQKIGAKPNLTEKIITFSKA